MSKTKTEIEISAKDNTRRAFASAKSRMEDMDKKVNALSGSMRALAGGAAIGAVVAGMSAVVKRSLDTVDAIDKQSGAVGLSTSAWQKYIFAASQSGVTQEKLASGMGALNKRVGELKAGTGSLTTFLRKYDKELYENVKASGSTEEAAKLIFKAMGEAETSMDRAALSAAAFSRGAGIEMQNMVRGGAGALDELTQKAEKLGIVLDEDLIANAVNAKDELDVMSRVIDAQLTEALVKLSPVLLNITGAFVSVATAAGDAWTAFEKFTGIDEEAIKTRQLEAMNEQLTILTANYNEMAEAMLEVQFGTDAWKIGVKDLNTLDGAIVDLREEIKTLENGAEKTEETFTKLSGTGSTGLKGTTKKAKTLEQQLQKLGFGLKDISKDTMTANAGLDAGIISWDEYADKVFAAEGMTEDFAVATEKTAKVVAVEVSEMSKVWDNMLQDVQGAWGDMFADNFKSVLKDGELDFSTFTDSILDMFLDMLGRMAAAWAAEAIFGGGIGSANALFSAGSGGGGGNIFSTAVSAGLKKYGGSYAGGVTTSGGGGMGVTGVSTAYGATAGGATLGTAGGTVGVGTGAATIESLGAASSGAASSGAGLSGIGATALSIAPMAAIVAFGEYSRAKRRAEMEAVTQEALTSELFGAFQTAETAFLGMSDATTSFTQNLDQSRVSVHALSTNADVMTAAYRSVGISVSKGTNGLLKMKGSVEEVKAITEAYNSEAAAGLQKQIDYQAQLNADMEDGVIRGHHMQSAIATVTAEFSKSALEAAGLAGAMENIPKDITTTHTIITNAEGSSSSPRTSNDPFTYHDQRASGTFGQWMTVPPGFNNDDFTVGMKSNEKYKVMTPGETDGGDLSQAIIAEIKRQGSLQIQAINNNTQNRVDIVEKAEMQEFAHA